VLVGAVLCLLTVGLYPAPALSANSGLIGVHQGQFWEQDHPFVYAGTNTYYLMVFSADLGLRPYVDEVMGKSAAMKLTVMRTWAFNDGAGQWNALQTAPGVYQEYVFQGLDYVLYRADKLGVRVILTLVNNWDDYGGMNQYVAWSATASTHDHFYTDANCKDYYKAHISAVLNRVNTFNSRTYKDDPTILAWELANEPKCWADPSGDTLDGWVSEMTAYIKSIDPKHLVSTGMESTGWGGEDFVRNHGHASVDFSSVHLWPDHWGWGLSTCLTQLQGRIGQSHINLAKPIILGEFGKYRPLATRDSYYSSFYSTLDTYNAAGSNYWMQQHDAYPDYDGFAVYYPAHSSTITIITGQSATAADLSAVAETFADAVESFSQGADGGHGVPANAMGLPDANTWSMGRGGQVVLRFTDNLLIDGPGADLVVYEDSVLQGAAGVAELASVSISIDGASYTLLGTAEGTTAFDIGSAALNPDACLYVKIEDDGDTTGEIGSEYQGFDLNAVHCIHSKRQDFSKPVRVEPGADVVVNYAAGTNAGNNDPRNVLGLPGGPSLSLGAAGSILLKFTDNTIVDRDGADFIVFEGTLLPGDTGVAETAFVSVSQDGSAFTSVGTAFGTTQFDLAGTGLSEVSYVKVEDEAGGADDDPSGGHGGYDLNAVAAIHYVSAIAADLNKDGSVDFGDIGVLSGAYGSSSGAPHYNPDVDLNGDDQISFEDIGPFSGAYGSVVEDYMYVDIDGDGCVDATDQAILTAAFGATITDAAYDAAADLNDDGVVDSNDQSILDVHMGTCPGQ